MAGRLVDYIGSGLAAALPAAATIDAALTPDAAGFFYATDTQTLYCLDRSGTPSWDQIVTGAGGYTAGGTDVALADGGTGASLADPGADRLMFWDDSAGQVTWLSPGTGLSITGTTLDATGIGLSDGDKGDVTVSVSGTVWTVDNDAITYAKMQNVSAASKLLGRGSAGGAGDVEEIALGTGLSMSGTTVSVSGFASTSQTAEAISGFIASPSDKDYRIVVKIPHGGTITETTTRSASGTCTATFKVNTTALGGTANSVSSSEQSQSHASSNTFAAGDDIVLTVSSNSSCADMSFTIKYTRTLA